jgi:hypothetical protein
MKYIIFLLFAIVLFACSSPDESNSNNNCEVVINTQGPGFLKVINKFSSTIEVFLPEYAFSAEVRTNTCETYGLGSGTRQVKISICVNNDCNNVSNTKVINFVIENGKTYIIEVTNDFF